MRGSCAPARGPGRPIVDRVRNGTSTSFDFHRLPAGWIADLTFADADHGWALSTQANAASGATTSMRTRDGGQTFSAVDYDTPVLGFVAFHELD